MIKTLAGYDVDKDISNNLIFALKMSLLSERRLMAVVINMHKPPSYSYVMIMKVLQ